MNVHDLKGKTVALLASGGLDSCTITHWLTHNGVRVVGITADLAQPDESDFGEIEKRMRACGAIDFIAVDLKKEIAEIGLFGVQAQARYEGGYWNTTALARQVTTAGVLPELHKRGLKILSHGATGRGNDQVRFQLITNMLDPSIDMYVPWRDPEFLARFRGRVAMIEYCEQHGLPVRASREQPYSTDANLLGLTHEGGNLESIEEPATIVTPEVGLWPWDAPVVPDDVTIRFEQGRPVSIQGERMDILAIFKAANDIAGRHGIGIGVHVIENRFVGVKSRGVYEQPGMELLGKAYDFLIQAIIDRRTREFFDICSTTIARQTYQGYLNDVTTRMASQAIAEVSALATGVVTVKLYKGTITFVKLTEVANTLFNADSSMENEGTLEHSDSEGFVRVLGVHARALARAGQTKSNGG